MSTLLEITKSLEDLFLKIEEYESEGLEVPECIQDQLNLVLTEQAEKVDKCAQFISISETQIDFLKNEKKVLDAHIKRIESRIDRLKELAKYVMLNNSLPRLEGLRGHSFSLRRQKSLIVDVQPHELPDKFVRVTTEYAVDKKALKKELETNAVEGCRLVDGFTVTVK